MTQHATRSGAVDPPENLAGEVSDAELLRRVARQDVEAFGAFYDRHVAAALGLSLRTFRNRQRADDVCQEAFLSVWRSAGRFDEDLGTARTWVLTIVRNRGIDHLRRARRATEHEVADVGIADRYPVPDEEGTEHLALANVRDAELRALLAVLTPEQRQAVELSFFGGYTHVEIAARLGVPLGTVKARISRGLAALRGAMGSRPVT